jgi:hypothetical protein
MNFANYILIGLLALGFLVNVYWDIEGRPARTPYGFFGVLITMVCYGALVFLYYTAGLFGK